MAIVFALRGDSIDARYSRAGKTPGISKKNTDSTPAPATFAHPSVFGGKAISLSGGDEAKTLIYPGRRNFSTNQAWTIVMRIVPNWNGLPGDSIALFTMGSNQLDASGDYPQFHCFLRPDGLFQFILFGANREAYISNLFDDGSLNCVAGQAFEIMFSWDGLSGGGKFKYSRDGVQKNTDSSGPAWSALNYLWIGDIKIGFYRGQMNLTATDYAVNEFLIYDTAEAHVYTPPTTFRTVSAVDGLENTGAGAANIADGVIEVIEGITATGSLAFSDPPDTSDVRYGVNYIENNVTLTGSLQIPASVSGGSRVVNIGQIKENVRYILDQANTTTALVDLSNGLTDRVNKVLKLNPMRIPVQPSWYPYVTCFVDQKTINVEDITNNQSNSKRRAEIGVKVIGAVYYNPISDDSVDSADGECETLMENVEEIIRRNSTLAGTAMWSRTEGVTYHNLKMDEEAHLRVGILDLRASVFY